MIRTVRLNLKQLPGHGLSYTIFLIKNVAEPKPESQWNRRHPDACVFNKDAHLPLLPLEHHDDSVSAWASGSLPIW